ncbi:MAG TPA: ATPase [Caldithrix sp.]|nr:ATPase [Caldithrix sp.]
MIEDKFIPLRSVLERLMIPISVLAIVSLVAEYGFYLSPRMELFVHRLDVIIIWYFVIQALVKILFATNRLTYLKGHWFDYLLVLLVIAETALFIRVTGLKLFGSFLGEKEIIQITKIYIVAFQVSIILSLFSEGLSLNRKIATFHLHPSQVLLGSFLIIIIIGSALLSMPRAVMPGKSLSFLGALFTATSATCVTGLIVVDTGHHFSLMGQLIILMLIQIGGLGLMTYASFFALILRRNISLREKSMLRDMLNYENLGLISKVLASTVLFTFVLEILGALLLFWGMSGEPVSLGRHIYTSIFHSISAFCNAGFSLYSDSFMQYKSNYLVMLTISGLIIVGGLGFPVLVNLMSLRLSSAPGSGRWLKVQSRLVLRITGILLLVGFLFFLFAENNNTLLGLSWSEKLLNAFFQSVTTRTAGFNTVDIGLISIPTVLLFLVLMFIGASPGSTGGGIKTTTIGVLFAGVGSIIRGRKRIEIYKKNIPFAVLNRALVIILYSLSFVFLTTLVLSLTENLPFIDILFETFSAFGTVGLSRGITPLLSDAGKMMIILTMFFGRLGALTISLAITAPKEVYHYEYPPENVMVG